MGNPRGEQEERAAIRVEINVKELPKPLTCETWGNYIFKRLNEAGMPVHRDGRLLNGIIAKYDDREDFGKTVYIWRPKNEHI